MAEPDYWRDLAGRAAEKTWQHWKEFLFYPALTAGVLLALLYLFREPLGAHAVTGILLALLAASIVLSAQIFVNVVLVGSEMHKEVTTALESARQELGTVRGQQPNARVKILTDNKVMCLDVTNVGGTTGTFEAQLVVVDGKEFLDKRWNVPSPYTGYWLFGKASAVLLQGHSDKLVIGALNRETATAWLRMGYWDKRKDAAQWYNSSSWLPGITGGPPIARLTLKVSISATPPLINGPLVKVYVIQVTDDEQASLTELDRTG
jgi:hypothetical protein